MYHDPRNIRVSVVTAWLCGYCDTEINKDELIAIATLERLVINEGSRRKVSEEMKMPYRTLSKRLKRYREIGLHVPEAQMGKAK